MNGCLIAIKDGEVCCAVVDDGSLSCRETIDEWLGDRSVTEIVRVPVGVARRYLFQAWIGREAAIAAVNLASEPV
jgi:hypothetical protein